MSVHVKDLHDGAFRRERYPLVSYFTLVVEARYCAQPEVRWLMTAKMADLLWTAMSVTYNMEVPYLLPAIDFRVTPLASSPVLTCPTKNYPHVLMQALIDRLVSELSDIMRSHIGIEENLVNVQFVELASKSFENVGFLITVKPETKADWDRAADDLQDFWVRAPERKPDTGAEWTFNVVLQTFDCGERTPSAQELASNRNDVGWTWTLLLDGSPELLGQEM